MHIPDSVTPVVAMSLGGLSRGYIVAKRLNGSRCRLWQAMSSAIPTLH